jgi:hypothetical protein
MRREEELSLEQPVMWEVSLEGQRMPKIFRPMITTSGTPQSQRMMLFIVQVSKAN